MNHYETVFILTPVLSDAQMKEAVDKVKDVITSANGTIVNEENWGLRKLAYPIQKKSTGFYTLIEFDARTHYHQEARDSVPPRRAHAPLAHIPSRQVRS